MKRREFTDAQRRAIFDRCEGRCVDCESDVGPFDYDHDKPLWLGGLSVVENGVLRCRDTCHGRKTAAEAPIRAKVERIAKRLAGRKIGNHQARNRKQRRRVREIDIPF